MLDAQDKAMELMLKGVISDLPVEQRNQIDIIMAEIKDLLDSYDKTLGIIAMGLTNIDIAREQ